MSKGKDVVFYGDNSIEKKKKDVRKYSALSAVSVGMAGLSLLTCLIFNITFLAVIVWGAVAAFSMYKVNKSIH